MGDSPTPPAGRRGLINFTQAVEDLGFHDMFIQAGQPRAAQFTWDSKVNKFHTDGFPFTVRYGRGWPRYA